MKNPLKWTFIFFKFRIDNPDWYTCDEDGENVKLKDNVPERVRKAMKCGKLGKNIILMKEILWMMNLINNVLFSDINYLKSKKSSTNY